MKRKLFLMLSFLLVFLAACAQPSGNESPQEDPAEGGYTLEWLSRLSPDTILIQLDYEPTYSMREYMFAFGRVPPFTLYADGTAIFVDDGASFDQQQVLSVRLTPERTLGLLREVMDMGFEGLEDYLDFCGPVNERGEQECIADASFIIVAATLSDGSFKSVKSYGNFSNDPAALQEITQLLNAFSSPEAVPYEPGQAALFVTGLPSTMERPQFEWPLDPSFLQAGFGETRAAVLEGAQLRRLIEAVGKNTGSFYFENAGAGFQVYLVPWLPTDDFTIELEAEYPGISAAPIETAAPVPEPIFMIEEAAKADLAARLGTDAGSILLYQVDQVDWPDGCLGIVLQDMGCTDAIVPGFRLLLDVAGVSYEYRSNLDGSLLLPADQELPMLEAPEAILIAAPGAGSRVVSPILVSGEADPTFEQTLVVRVLLADGAVLAQKAVTIQADAGGRGSYSTEIEFDVDGEQQGFIQVFSTSARDGGITHLSSVGVAFASDGEADIRPPVNGGERIIIEQPTAGETIRSGVVHVVGFALATFEQTLVVEILGEDGTVLASMPVIVQAPDWGFPGPFSADLPLSITAESAGRIVVRDPSPAFDGDAHINSIEIRLAP